MLQDHLEQLAPKHSAAGPASHLAARWASRRIALAAACFAVAALGACSKKPAETG